MRQQETATPKNPHQEATTRNSETRYEDPEYQIGRLRTASTPMQLRGRERKAVMEHPDYYKLREHLITFLEVHAHKKTRGPVELAGPKATPPPPAGHSLDRLPAPARQNEALESPLNPA